MSQTNQQPVLLAVSAPPFWHCGRTVKKASYAMLLALAPAAFMAVWHWGIPAARVMALAMVTGIATEALCQKIMGQDISVDDFSGAVSCLLFAFLLPANAPWWLVMLGAALAIGLGKMAFGGLGANAVNTALVGWAMLYVSWPALMDPNSMQLDTSFIDPLVRLKYFGAGAVSHIDLTDLLLGNQIGGLGASQAGALFIGGSYLAARGTIRWEIALSFFVGVFLTAALYNVIDAERFATPFFHLCTGSTFLGGFFLATEWASSPGRQIPMMLYGLIGGAMVIIIRVYGIYPDGVPFAILLINLERGSQKAASRAGLVLLLLVGGSTDATAKIFEELGQAPLKDTFLLITFVTALLLCMAVCIARRQSLTGADLLFGLLIGAPNYFSSRFLLLSLNDVPAVIAYPTYSVGTIVLIALLGVWLFHERLSRRQTLAMGMILAALALLNL